MVIKMTLFAFVILGIIVIYKLSKYNDKKKLNTVLKKDTEVENVSELINKIDEKIQNTKKELEENQEAYSQKLQSLNEDLITLEKFKKEKNGQE